MKLIQTLLTLNKCVVVQPILSMLFCKRNCYFRIYLIVDHVQYYCILVDSMKYTLSNSNFEYSQQETT